MPEHSRIRRILKWAGLVVCGLISLLWVITFFREFGYAGARTAFTIGPGYFGIFFHEPFLVQGWFFVPTESSFRCWWPIPHLCGNHFLFPFSLLLVVIAIPTAFLFWRDRRIPPGHCQSCGYNLRGNVSGVCPECGTPVNCTP
jgi:hypothetical protein